MPGADRAGSDPRGSLVSLRSGLVRGPAAASRPPGTGEEGASPGDPGHAVLVFIQGTVNAATRRGLSCSGIFRVHK